MNSATLIVPFWQPLGFGASVAEALSYRDSSGLGQAVKWIEAGSKKLRTAIDRIEPKLR